MAAGYLVEVDTVARPRNWVGQATIFADSLVVFANSVIITAASSTGTYVATLSPRVLLITAVTEEGVALTERGTPALVSANAGSWYWEGAGHRLWVRTTDDAQALGHRLLATVVDGYQLGAGPAVYLRNGVPVAYEGRVMTLPDVGVALQTESNDPVLGAVVSLGALVVANQDGLVEEWLAERLVAGRAVRCYRGELGDTAALTGPDVSSLDLWLAALTDSVATTPETGDITLMSRSRLLTVAALTTTFDLVTYPDMDPEIAGMPIPQAYGRIVKAQAFRIAAGRWKVAAHAIGDLFSAVTGAGPEAPILTLALELGEFTVDPAYDGEARLYVDLDGTVGGALRPGGLLRQVLLDTTAVTDADLDLAALAALDATRPALIGFQLVEGTVRDALDRVARSAFADWFLTRQGIISARARLRGGSNLITNPSFEMDLAGWRALLVGVSSLTREAAGVSGPDGDWMAKMIGLTPGYGWNAGSWVQSVPGRSLTVTCLMSTVPTLTLPQGDSGFRFMLWDVTGLSLAQSDTITAPVAQWRRAHWRVDGQALETLHAATAASTDFFANDTTLLVVSYDESGNVQGETGTLAANVAGNIDLWLTGTSAPITPLGPESGVFVDDVRVTATVQADDMNAEVTAITPEPLVLWQVSVPYRVDARTRQGPLAVAQDAAAQDLYPLAEARTIDADCVDATSAQLVADAYLDWYGHARARTTMRLYDWTQPIEPGDVIDAWALSRTLRPPLASQLYTVVSVREAGSTSTGAPTIDVEAILHYDPAVGPLVRV